MRLRYRVHEWLADHVSWVQYPVMRPRAPRRPLMRRWGTLSRRDQGWRLFWIFWGGLVLLSVYGNLVT